MLNEDKVTSVRFSKVLATKISQEKKFEPYFRVPIKYPINLQDYIDMYCLYTYTYLTEQKCGDRWTGGKGYKGERTRGDEDK